MPLKKLCTCCKQEKLTEFFYVNKRAKSGFNTYCIECHKEDSRARKAKNRQDPAFLQAERDAQKERRRQNTQKYIVATQKWRAKNTVHVRDYGKSYRTKNSALINFLCQKRKLALLNRTPAWLGDDDFWMIEQAYDLAALRTKMLGFAWHVDHTLPLRGKLVSGLHVPQNLRVIPASENQRKSNRFEVQNA